jgi:hypothetical protein
MNRLLSLMIVCCGCLCTGTAQEILPLDQRLRLAQYELEWWPPTAAYRLLKPPVNNFYPCDFYVQIRKEGLQIRYLMVPVMDVDDERSDIPQIQAATLAMHLADNEEDSYISSHQLDPGLLDSVYQADWGEQFFFHPKPGFSSAKNCQMLALFREGVAMGYIFLLFDEAPLTLPEQAQTLRFWRRKLKN